MGKEYTALGAGAMKTVTIEFTDEQARQITWMLRRRYERDGRTPLGRLCRTAILQEAADQAVIERDIAYAMVLMSGANQNDQDSTL